MTRHKEKRFIVICLLPALFCFVILFIYPVIRTAIMSFFTMKSFTDGMKTWSFAGLENYIIIFKMPLFGRSFGNLFRIWLIGGVVTLCGSLFYAVVISSGVKGKSFWRSIVYLPNIISMVALANMWTQYIYNTKFGLLTSVFKALRLESLAAVQYTSEANMFKGMLFSFCFGCIGYYMLIFLAGVDSIPDELYESANIDGAGRIRSFFFITLPLLRNVFRTSLTLWTITASNFFIWSMAYSRFVSSSTAVPGVLMYNLIFGSKNTASVMDPGGGAAVGVCVTLAVVSAYTLLNLILPERRQEY